MKNLVTVGLALLVIGLAGAAAEEAATAPLGGGMMSGTALAAIGAAIALAVSAYGTSKGLEISGNTAAAVTGEDEKSFSTVLVMEAMPQTQVIYGFIIAVLIVLGIMGKSLTVDQGYIALAAGISVGFAGLSAISQGSVAASAMGATQKNPEIKGKAMIFIVLPEIAALFGFVVSILLLISGNIL